MGKRTVNRTTKFSAGDWTAFLRWLNYVERGIRIAVSQAQNGDDGDSGELGVSTAVAGMRAYAIELSQLQALTFRAAGLRDDERICQDDELTALNAELEAMFPELRDLRNALFAHPPFVDELVDDQTVLFFTSMGIFKAPAGGGAVHVVIQDPLLSAEKVLDIVGRFRALLEGRMAAAIGSSTP
jgi:hypothetical protein